MSFTTIKKLAALAMFFAVCIMLTKCENDAPAQENANTPLPEVGIVIVKSESLLLSTELPGRVSSFRVAEIRPQVSGLLQKRFFTEGADVVSGQQLYQIDPDPFQAELDKAEANLAVVKKTVERTRAALQASFANVNQQKATLDFAQKNRKRFEELIADGAVSLTERDQAVTQDEVAQAALKSAEAQVMRDREVVAEAEAAIKQAEAVVKSARINLEYTHITAPISGRIGRSNITEGAIVMAYQATPLSTIQQLDPIYVDVPQSTTELLRLRQRLEKGGLNQEGADHKKVKILLEDGSEYSQEGDLQFRDITVDPTTASVVLRILVPNPESVLLPGMYVQAVVKEGEKHDALMIPQQAVMRDHKGDPYVMLVNDENQIEQRMIIINRAIGNQWFVSDGLSQGDRVVVEGSQKVHPGSSVKAIVVESKQNNGDENEG
ncbi:MAG: efflux RND transporter periplasmic adaptor subunit [Candidatus Omnitrophica bacterium]|nr:efflux RND transporter periplasmic adaptor subunit [Candidatus Omnitrophota bacterium]